MKKVISWILALSMCSGMFGNLAYAENTAAIDADIILEDVQAAEALPLDGVELEDDVGGEVKGETEETSIITEEGNSHESITEDSDKVSVETIISTDIVETENNANLSVKSIESPNYQVLEATAFESEPEASWELVGNLTRNVEANVSVAIGKYIYVIPKETPDKLYRYDTERNSTILTTVSADVNEVKSAVAKGEYIYVLTDEYLYRINGFSKTWEEVGDASEWKDDEGVLVLFKNTVCFANRKGLYYYDTDLEKWRVYTVFHEEFLNPISAAYADGGRVYIIPEYSNTIYMFDHDMDITKELTLDDWNNILPWYAFIGCGKNGRLYLVGGYEKELVNEDDWMLGPEEEWDNPDYWNTRVVDSSMAVMCDFNDMTIDYMAGFPLESSDHSLTYCNGCVYIMGGDDLLSNGASKVYSLDVKEWDVPEVDDNKIAVGENYYLYLDDDDDVYVYGDNTYGQLGLGDYDFVSEELELPINNSIKSVYTSNSSSAILDYSGRLWMFGKNDSYQLAMEDTTGINTPYKVMDNIVKVSFGNNHVLALSKEGKVYSWGGNEYGELGNVVDGVSWIPREINICDNKIVDIAAGGEHSVALDETGTAYTWGSNSRGQMMKDPSALEYSIISLPIPLENVYSVHASNNYTILIDYSGNVYTLGDNSRGQIGTFLIAEYSTVPCHVTDIKGAQKIATAHDRIYIWDAKNKIYSFGDNVYGLLGASSTDAYNMSVQSIDSKVSITDIWVLNNKTYMRTADEDIYKCGLMTDNEAVEFNLLNIDYPLKITQIDSYRNQTLAIDESGEVIAWGEGYYANGSDSTETYYYPMRIDGIIEPVQVSRGKNHNLVLDANGDVWGWGSNSNNPMGKLDGKVKVATKIDGFENVKKVAAGTEFSIVLKNDGTLWGVGKNDRGQLCREGTTSVTTPIQLTEKTDFIDVSVGESYVAAVATDGIYTWGGNEKGQLGNGTTTDSYTSNKLEVVLENNEKFVSVSAGIDFCMALTNLGNVYTWGDNGSGALGTGNRISHYIPTQNTGLSNIVNIEAGKSSSYAIDNDGKVYGWGYAYDGQFIDYDARILTPKEITQLSDIGITDVALGYDFMVALSNDNKLYSCGSMDNGKLGYYAAKPVLDKSSNLVKDVLWLNSVMSELTASPLTENIDLPVKGEYGSKITWISSNDYYIDSEGTVHRPDCYGKDTAVKLYATISNGVDKFTPTYTAIVKQDPTIQPSTDVLDRTIGFEYEQIYPEKTPEVYPEIVSVSYVPDEDTPGVYQLFVENTGNEADDQFKCSTDNPFFFWSSRQGTFKPVNGHEETFDRVLFTVDDEYLDETVKVTVGIGDNLGYIDKKYITLEPAVPSETSEVAEVSEIALLSEDSSSASVSLAIGLDMSANMQNFDTTSYKTWMNSVEGLIESAGDNGDIALLTDGFVGYPVDTDAAKTSLEFLKTNDYSGDTDAETMLDRCIASLQDSENMSQHASKVAVVFANKVSDAESLKNKISELEQQGIAVYIMLLGNNDTAAFDDIENVYDCNTELSLRLNMSELYNAFSSMAQVMTADGTSSSDPMISDFKPDSHMLNFTNTENEIGGMFASILALYHALPVNVEGNDDYNLVNVNDNYKNAEDVRDLFMSRAANVETTNANQIATFYQTLVTNNLSSRWFYKLSPANDDKGIPIVNENLKYRFPVLVITEEDGVAISSNIIIKSENGKYFDSTQSEVALNDKCYVFDTYSYLLTLSTLPNIKDEQDAQNSDGTFYNKIKFTIPEEIICEKIGVSSFADTNKTVIEDSMENLINYEQLPTPIPTPTPLPNEESLDTNNAAATLTYTNNTATLSGIKDKDEYVFGIKTTYSGLIPNMYNTTKYYKVLKYKDETEHKWYYPYVYKATNLGVVNGRNTSEGDLYFWANDNITRAEFFKIVLESANVDVSLEDDEKTTGSWGDLYIKYMIENIDLYSAWTGFFDNVSNGKISADSDDMICYNRYFYNMSGTDGDNVKITNPSYVTNIERNCADITRREAAYVLYRIFLKQQENINVASRLHEYSNDISCYQIDRWNTSQYNTNGVKYIDDFKDINADSAGYDYIEAMKQLYCNNIIVGDGKVLEPQRIMTRAEMCKAVMSCLFTLDDGLQNTNAVQRDEKVVYIVLYDSLVGNHDLDSENETNEMSTMDKIDNNIKFSRYYNSDMEDYVYDEDFFVNYLNLIGDKKVAFVLSVRDVDFDANRNGYQSNYGGGTNSERGFWKPNEITDTRMNNIVNVTVGKYNNIISSLKSALDIINTTREVPMELPYIYLGTPHTAMDQGWINVWITEDNSISASTYEDAFLTKYLDVTQKIYNGVADKFGEEIITGLYYGREDPDAMYYTDSENKEYCSLSYRNMSQVGDFIHKKDKKMLWIPYSESASQWKNIAQYTNSGKSCNGTGYDLFDIVMMQPGIYFSSYSGTLNDIKDYNVAIEYNENVENGYDNQKRKIRDLYETARLNSVIEYGALKEPKTTKTIVSFQIEYDISLVTGRIHNDGIQVKSTRKADNFEITYDIFEPLINDSYTSFAIYSGGPNEQDYKSDMNNKELENQNRHCSINHRTYFSTMAGKNVSDPLDGKAYSTAKANTSNDFYYATDYSSLIYDITKGLLHGKDAFSDNCKVFLSFD